MLTTSFLFKLVAYNLLPKNEFYHRDYSLLLQKNPRCYKMNNEVEKNLQNSIVIKENYQVKELDLKKC